MKRDKLFAIAAITLVLASCKNNDGDYDASGIFESTEVIVSAKGNGEIMQLDIEEGQNVDSMQMVGYIDTLQLSFQKEQLNASLNANDSRHLNEDQQLSSIRQQISNLQKEQKRFQQLVNADAASQKQLDYINYQIQTLKKQLSASAEQIGSSNKSIKGQSSSIEAQIAQINERINDDIICSPIKGVVLTKYAEKGEYAVPGKALFKVSDIGLMKLRAYITANQLTSLKLGQKVKVYADQGTDERKEYQGTVAWISDKAEFTPKTIQTRDERANLVYAIKIAVHNDGLIKRGMYGDVKF